MKRVLALILCILTITCTFASCSTLKDDDKGAIVDVYLTNEIYNYDPAVGYTDASTAKILSLIFEGLTKLDADGKYHNGLMKSYEITQDDEDGFKVEITLRNTRWSDSRRVQANDIVFAWKRILDPEFKCEAASMLYDIKNARDVKMGDASIDDFGVAALETYVLEIEFEKKIDLDDFFTTTASLALVPLREDIVAENTNWAKKAATMITNGPFDVKELVYGEKMRLERSAYYYRDTDKDQDEQEALDKYVLPYRIVTHYEYGDLTDQLDELLCGNIFYLGEIPLDKREEYTPYANASDIPVTHTYFFNTKNELFANADVRRALSMAIDREKVAEIVRYAKPATGYIAPGVYDFDGKTYFRDNEANELIKTTADVEGAKALLKSAGVNGGNFSISVRGNDEVDSAVADYVKGVWEELGFKVRIHNLGSSTNADDSTVVEDDFYVAYTNGDFDVIALDAQMLTSSAYCMLAPFATPFSGNGVDIDTEEIYGHVTGYDSEEYNKLFESVYETADLSERSALLHTAEEKLIEDAVVMPVFFEQDAFLFADKLGGLGATYFGRDFTAMSMKDYLAYNEAQETAGDEFLNEVGD